MIEQWIKKICNITFWRRNAKAIVIFIGAIIITATVILFTISGQQDVGAQQAGEQIVKLVQNIRNRYKTRPDFWGLSTTEVINKKIHPQSMKVVGNQLVGYFNNPVEVGGDDKGTPVMPTSRKFVIAYGGLNKQQCIGLASLKFDADFWLGVTSMEIKNSESSQIFDWSSKELVLPADKSKVKPLCQSKNIIVFNFE